MIRIDAADNNHVPSRTQRTDARETKSFSKAHRMWKNAILGLPITDIIREDIALPLHHVFQIYTVGSFLQAWANPSFQREIEELFDSPDQARHAAATCAGWIGAKVSLSLRPERELGWWRDEQRRSVA